MSDSLWRDEQGGRQGGGQCRVTESATWLQPRRASCGAVWEHCGGFVIRNERVVHDRNRITGGGVTAGIDFGLTLAALLRSR
jgi:transcriptional regulator GlxA family with amidase domain